jgi:hypothetical protein
VVANHCLEGLAQNLMQTFADALTPRTTSERLDKRLAFRGRK